MSNRIKMTVELDVTPSQAIALEAMFDYWTFLGGVGSSRMVAFYVDGDGNFRSKCKVSYSEDPMIYNENPYINKDALKKLAVVKDKDGDKSFDFDPVAWSMHKPTEER